MNYVLIAAAAAAVGVVAFIWWRYTSVARGARRRDERIIKTLAPLEEMLTKKQPVAPSDIFAHAQKSHVRPLLFGMLKHFERLDLFPKEFLTTAAQGDSVLSYWLMHPNELQDVPVEMELVETIRRKTGEQQQGDFLVYRYKMPDGHWAAKQGWLLGLAGPFLENDAPYSGHVGAFSRGDEQGKVKPEELVDWFIGLVNKK